MLRKATFFVFLLSLIIFPITILAAPSLDQVNQNVCNGFEEDLNKMAAIMEELRRRKGIMETRVAYGQVDTPIERADYQITFAAEALAFQRAQKFSSVNSLKNSLGILRGKILNAKSQVSKAI